MQVFGGELNVLLVGRDGDLILNYFSLVVLVLVIHLRPLARTVVDFVRIHLLRAKHAAGRNVYIFLYVLLLVRNGSLRCLGDFIQVPSTLGILGFRGDQALIEIRLELLVSIEILNHEIQIVLVFRKSIRRLACLVSVFHDASVATSISISVSISDSRYTLRILSLIRAISVIDFSFWRI